MTCEKLSCRTCDRRSRERRPGHPHVARGDDPLRLHARDVRARRNRSDDPPARSRELRLLEAVGRVAEGRPRCDGVVGRGRGAVLVGRADRDHERVVRGSVPGVDREARAVVADRRHDDDAVQPQLLDRLVERVEAEARHTRGDERQVRDADVVLRLVLEDPVRSRDHVARAGLAEVVRRPDTDERGVLPHARIQSRRACRNACDHRPVTLVVTGGTGAERGQVDARDETAAEVVHLARVDAAVHDCDRGSLRSQYRCRRHARRIELEAREGIQRARHRCLVPQRRDVRRGPPHLRVDVIETGEAARLDYAVGRDHVDVRILRQLDDVCAGDAGGDAVDGVEAPLELALVALDAVAHVVARVALRALHDHVERLAGVGLRSRQEGRRDVCLMVRVVCETDGRKGHRHSSNGERDQSAATLAPQHGRSRVAAAATSAPQGTTALGRLRVPICFHQVTSLSAPERGPQCRSCSMKTVRTRRNLILAG